jgi:hypothetical protein
MRASALSLGARVSSIAIMTNSDSVIFERKAVKIDRVWSVIATHPSGQQEHIVGFHTEAEAMEWRVSQGCRAWLTTRGYVGWKLGAPVRIKRLRPGGSN